MSRWSARASPAWSRGWPRCRGSARSSITTNGVLLADRIDDLVAAGLGRVNVSIDSLDPERFEQITRRRDLHRALAGLEACERHESLRPIKVNAVALRGVSEPDVLPLAELARRRPYVVRFIEVMPLDAPRTWTRDAVLSGEELRAMIGARWPLEPLDRERPAAPATRWRFADGAGELQFVSSVTEPFCASCDRLRLTADGQLRTCLFAESETDLRGPAARRRRRRRDRADRARGGAGQGPRSRHGRPGVDLHRAADEPHRRLIPEGQIPLVGLVRRRRAEPYKRYLVLAVPPPVPSAPHARSRSDPPPRRSRRLRDRRCAGAGGRDDLGRR